MEDLKKFTNAQLLLKISALEARIEKLEKTAYSDGFFLDGVPEYVVDYAKQKNLVGEKDE